ncbi:hypothetical protein ACF063_43380 [Streptomyces chartreusis]|uniref:hypothetical protein n=1 Tax=Streptomyces chartreusis TaxID=1969 RepID=UPI0037004E14
MDPPADAAQIQLVVAQASDSGPEGVPRAGATVRRPPNGTARLTVRLEGELLELTLDRERTQSLVTTVYQLLDRPGLAAIGAQLSDASAASSLPSGSRHLPLTGTRVSGMGAVADVRAGDRAVADLWEEEVSRLDRRISGWLIEVEDRATSIVLRRLRDSRAAAVRERDRYLTGLPTADPNARNIPLADAQPGPAAEQLRMFLQEVARLRTEARAALTEFTRLAGRGVPHHEVLSARNEVLQKIAIVHRYVAEAARTSPLLYWIVDWEAEPVIDLDRRGGSDLILCLRVVDALRRCWRSSWAVQDRVAAMPARSSANAHGPTPEQRVGDTIEDVDEAGPWRFPTVIQQALDELGLAGPTPQAAAVSRTMAAAGGPWNQSLSFAAGSFALSTAVHAILPPAAVVVDYALGAVDLFAEIGRHGERTQEHEAILDQAQALTPRPSGQEVAAAVIGMLIAPLDGTVGLLMNALPTAVSTWTPPAEETRL